MTVSLGILGSPVPDRLMADTLNSYAAPSKTSLTANLVSVREKKHNKTPKQTYSLKQRELL